MPALSSAGIGSGLDVASLVNQLVTSERAPVANRLSRQESSIKLELSAFGKLSSALSTLKDAAAALSEADGLDARNATVPEDGPFTATAEAGAALGSYQIEVQQLAQAQRLDTATPLASEDTNVGYGQLDIDLGSDSFSVTIDAGSQTLGEVRDAINNAPDNPGVQASIINTDAGYILQLSSDRGGAESAIALSASGGDGNLNTLIADLAETQAASQAIVQVNGYQITSDSNDFTDVLDGVSFSATEARLGETFTLEVGRNNDTLKETVQEFVDAYNAYVDVAKQLSSYDADSGSAGALNGDALLRGVSSQLRIAIGEQYGSQGSSLGDFGLELDVAGRMSLDDAALSEVASTDFNKLRDFLSGDTGFAESISSFANSYIENDGLIDAREDSLNQRLDRIESSNDSLDLRMEQVRARYLRQFTALDAMLAQMQQTSSYLSQQLASLPGVGQ